MTNPNCLVCRGSGTVRDEYAGRDEACACRDIEPPNRDPYAPSSEGWAGDMFAGAIRRAAERQAEQDAHAAQCNDRPCKRCEKFVCACGKPYDGANNHRCRECWLVDRTAKALEPAIASVPKRFRWAIGASVETLRERVKGSPELVTRALAKPPTTDMILIGDTAAGKTSLVVAMFDAWLRQEPDRRGDARFVEAWWLAGSRSRHPLGKGEPPELEAACEMSLLVLDDLGTDTEDHREALKYVLLKRHNEELPTWITTGFPMEHLMGRYGSQVIRRIVEHGKRVTLGKP